ncbi:transposase [Escherichia albertii]
MSLSASPAVSGTSAFITESEVSTPVHPSASIVWLDAGMAKLATLSDDIVFEPVNSFQKTRKRW